MSYRDQPLWVWLIVIGTGGQFVIGFFYLTVAAAISFWDTDRAVPLALWGIGFLTFASANRLALRIRLNKLAGRDRNA
jgi:hypothetical protein